MQDLKYLTKSKRPFFSSLFRSGNRNKNTTLSLPGQHGAPRSPFFQRKRWQPFIYPLILVVLVVTLVPLVYLALKRTGPVVAAAVDTVKRTTDNEHGLLRRQENQNLFAQDLALFKRAIIEAPGYAASQDNGDKLVFTILPGLQQRVQDFLRGNNVPYGVVVALEPSTGRVLAMTSYSAIDPAWTEQAYFNLYPMASLFKIVTASAALEQKMITPHSLIEFRGRSCSENPRHWSLSPRGKNNRMDVAAAMGRSVNPVFGRIASEFSGKAALMSAVDKFGFNQELFPGMPVKASQLREPQSEQGVMLMGAGLDHDVKISPVHAAGIMAALANQGLMVAPVLAEKVVTSGGKEHERKKSRPLRQLVTPEQVGPLSEMLSGTVTQGTSRRAFYDRRGQPLIPNVTVAAKTGSIDGTEPPGHYSWFAAYAPIHEPKIALAVLVINHDRWKVKASQVGQQVLAEFFGS